MTRLNGILGRHSATIYLTLLAAGLFSSAVRAGDYSKSFRLDPGDGACRHQ
jgi:hypothetical protein